MRTTGRVLTLPEEPKGVLADEAKQIQKQRQERKIISGAKPPRPVPNYICYAFLFPNYDPKTGKGCPRPLPKCRVCRVAVLHPQENHVCRGYKPMFAEHDAEWHERTEARREAIREAKREADDTPRCSECDLELPEYEDYLRHAEEHESRDGVRVEVVRGCQAVNGDEDDLSGYEDWVDEDESYVEDDGDPMWE